MSIFGGWGSSARREAEFSKFKESPLERKISCSLWASLREDGGAVPPRGSPRALCQVPVLGVTRPTGGLGRRCSARGPEVCANLRQFAGRHFNCGFPHHRGPLAALREGGGGGSRLPFLSRLFPSLPRYPPPTPTHPWRPRRTSLRPVPSGAARVIPPGRGRLSLPKESRWGIAARPRVPGASGQYWCVSVRSGSISPPAIPGIRLCPLCRFPARRRPLARQRCAQLLGDVRSVPGFGTKSFPPGVVTPLNYSFTPRSRGAVLGRVETSISFKEENLRKHLRHFA